MNNNRKRILEEDDDDEVESINIVRNNSNNNNHARRKVDLQPTQDSNGATPSSQQLTQQSQQEQHYTSIPASKVYLEGSIVRVKLTNFVTYTELEFEPGPRLNVIIGPNGSGKSSIVCALALGLGGGTNLLGRAKQVSHFIKHGEDHAAIEITLFGTRGNTVVRRDIKKDNSSEYRVNGRKVTTAELQDRVKNLNIQVDNLCQFLPQDKVVSFAAMTPTELLVETEKAIGINNLYENHMSLIDLRKEVLNKQTQFSGQTNILEDLRKQNESLEKEVQRFQERKNILKRIEDFKKKKLWVLVDLAQKEYDTAIQTKKEIEIKITTFEKEKQPLQKTGDQLKNIIAKLTGEVEACAQEVRRLEQDANKKSANIRAFGEDIDKNHADIENAHKREEERKVTVINLQQQLQAIDQQIKNQPSEESVRAKIEEKNRVLKELNQKQGLVKAEMAPAKSEIDSLRVELNQVNQSIDQLNNISARRLDNLKRTAKHIYDAYSLKMRLKDRFEKHVYGPICIEVNVPNPEHTKYLENILNFNTMTTFVCQTANDKDMFYRELASHKINGITLQYLPRPPNDSQREYRLEDLRPFGIECFLDQTFETDKPVRDVLIASTQMESIAIGTNATIGREEDLYRNTGVKVICTPKSIFRYSNSKYGDRNLITNISTLKDVKLFSQGVNVQEKNDLNRRKQDVEQRLSHAQAEYAKIQAQETDLIKQGKILHEERHAQQLIGEERKKLYVKMNGINRKIEDFSKEEDTAADIARYKKIIKDLHHNRVNIIRDITKALVQIGNTMLKRDSIMLKKSKEEARYQKECAVLENLKRQIAEQQNHLRTAIDQANQTQKHLKECKAEANREAPIDEFAEVLEELPEDLDEIEEEIETLTENARLIGSTDPQVMRDYENRQKEIEQASNRINNFKSSLEETQSKMEEIKNDWIVTVRTFVEEINKRFTRYFKEIRCAGEVLLGYNEKDPDNFEQYSIDIKVRFRDEDHLQSLTAHLQSGGERSVATMLFLISLQDLTQCPFRVVDEINQGMDPKNERMIFDQIVKTANRPKLPQYFLITPKLLHDLEYSKNTTILCVFTGPWHVNQSEWEKSFRKAIKAKEENTQNNHN